MSPIQHTVVFRLIHDPDSTAEAAAFQEYDFTPR